MRYANYVSRWLSMNACVPPPPLLLAATCCASAAFAVDEPIEVLVEDHGLVFREGVASGQRRVRGDQRPAELRPGALQPAVDGRLADAQPLG